MSAPVVPVVLSALLPLLAAACAGGQPVTAPGPVNAQPPANYRELERIARAREDSMRMRFTPADVQFMTNMIGHHAQAIVMSRLAPERAASQAVRILAARIINAQQDEIATMQTWLRERGQPVPMVHDGMVHGGMGHAAHMPGMLTDAQLAELAAASGPAFDRRFLQSMIQHHRGATVMVKELFATDGAGQDEAVFKFASDVNVDQTTEIARMESMLESLPTAEGGR